MILDLSDPYCFLIYGMYYTYCYYVRVISGTIVVNILITLRMTFFGNRLEILLMLLKGRSIEKYI